MTTEDVIDELMAGGGKLTHLHRWLRTAPPAAEQSGVLRLAVEQQNESAVAILCAAGVDPDAGRRPDRSTALHVAAGRGEERIAAMLLEAGADVNAASTLGHTPFVSACYWGQLPLAQTLLAAGADLAAQRLALSLSRQPSVRAMLRTHELARQRVRLIDVAFGLAGAALPVLLLLAVADSPPFEFLQRDSIQLAEPLRWAIVARIHASSTTLHQT